jgi:hypothetical protein
MYMKLVAHTQNVEQVVCMQKCSHVQDSFEHLCSTENRASICHGSMASQHRQTWFVGKRDVLGAAAHQGLVGCQAEAGRRRGLGGLARCRQADGRGSSCGRTASYTEASSSASCLLVVDVRRQLLHNMGPRHDAVQHLLFFD